MLFFSLFLFGPISLYFLFLDIFTCPLLYLDFVCPRCCMFDLFSYDFFPLSILSFVLTKIFPLSEKKLRIVMRAKFWEN